MDEQLIQQNNKLDMSGLNKIFWGNIIVIIDFRLNGFDILPDFIGYIIMFLALVSLAKYNLFFYKARAFALISIFLSFFDFYQIQQPAGNVSFNNLLFVFIYSAVLLVISLYLVCYIIQAIEQLSYKYKKLELFYLCKSRWNAILYTRIITFIGSYLFIIMQAGILVLVLIIMNFIVEILYMSLLRSSFNTLDGLSIKKIDYIEQN